jgi:hypothetical protein
MTGGMEQREENVMETLQRWFEQELEATRESGDPHVTLTFREWNGDIAVGVKDAPDGESFGWMLFPDEEGVQACVDALRRAIEVVKAEALVVRSMDAAEGDDAEDAPTT